ADRPDRLIGDDQLAGIGAVGQRPGQLAGDERRGAARLALGAGLADADDRDAPGAPGRQCLGPDIGVGFAAGVAALGMADDGMATAGIPEHLGADIAGESSLGLGMAILASEPDAA